MKRTAEHKDDIRYMLFQYNERNHIKNELTRTKHPSASVENHITYLNDSYIILHAYFVHIILPLSGTSFC